MSLPGVVCTFFLIVVLDTTPCSSDSSPAPRSSLVTSILCDRDPEAPPSTEVQTKLGISIYTATVKEQILTMDVLALVEWEDASLSWTPSDYGNIENVDIPGAKIWTPSVVATMTLPWFRNDRSLPQSLWLGACDVASNGTVRCLVTMQVGGSCVTEVDYWPHVRSRCEVFFAGNRLLGGVLLDFIQNGTETPELNDYSPSQEWLVTELRRHTIRTNRFKMLGYVVLRLVLHRQGVVIADTTALTGIVLCIMILTTFFLPVGSQLRFGLGCCAFFSLLLISSLLYETLPSVGGVTPAVIIVHRCLILLAGLALLEPLVLSVLIPTDREPPPPPRWLCRLRTWFLTSATGKTILTVLLLSTSNSEKTSQAVEMMHALHMQAGGAGGEDEAESADNADERGDASDHVPFSTISKANARPHKIWSFFVSILDRGLFAFHATICLALSVYLIHAMLPFDRSYKMKTPRWLLH